MKAVSFFYTLEAALSEYRWNINVARHFFCSICGIYTFHRKRAAPDYYGVNVFCLENFEMTGLSIIATDGLSMSTI